MVLGAFGNEDAYLLASCFIFGYGILLFLHSNYLLGLSDVNIIIQSTALGLFLTAVISYPAKFVIKDTYYGDKADRVKDNFQNKFELFRLFGGSLLVFLGIII